MQSGHCGVVCVDGSILWRYCLRNGDLLARSWARVLRILCVRVCSMGFIGGGAVLSRLLCARDMLL